MNLLEIFHENPHLAVFISLGVSILVAVLGLVPSVFITAANIYFFGIVRGSLLSLAGEAIGALVAFLLYRFGFRSMTRMALQKYPRAQKLVQARGKEAFTLIVALRLIPFVPSGLVTFAAAVGEVSTLLFFISSSLGKIPALAIECYSVYQVAEFGWQGQVILAVAALGLIVWLLFGRRKKAGQ